MGRRLHSSLAAGAPIISFGLSPLAPLFGWRRSRRPSFPVTPGDTVPDLSAARALLESEIARARRYEQGFSIVVLQLQASTDPAPARANGGNGSGANAGNGSGANGGNGSESNGGNGSGSNGAAGTEPSLLRFVQLGAILRHVLRENDVVAYDAVARRFVLALPQTGGAGAQVAAERLRVLVHERAAVDVRAGAAAFPDDALILDDLLAAASNGRPLRAGSVES